MSEEQIVPSPENPLYTVGQVAKMFAVENATVRLWIKTERVKGIKINGQWRVQKSEVVRIANEEWGQ